MARPLARKAITLALLALVAYGLVCGWMYLRQRELLYFPGATRVHADATNFGLTRGGVSLRGWRFNAGSEHALVYFGGNAEAVQYTARQLADWFPDRTIYALAYRGYGASEGEPSEQALVADARALLDHVRARQPQADLAVMGRSLGSGVAAQAAASRPVQRLVLVTPFDSLVGVGAMHYPWLPVGLLMHDRFDSAAALAGFDDPVFILEAGQDRVVPPASTARLVAALPRPPERLQVEEADHNSVMASTAEIEALQAFLAR